MNRRTLLKSVVGSVTLGLAGCIARKSSTDRHNTNRTSNTGAHDSSDSSDSSDGGDISDINDIIDGTDGTDGNEETETDNATNKTLTDSKSGPALVKRSFDIVSSECGGRKRKTRVSFDNHTVRVTGTIRGSNSCYTAELKNCTFEQGTLTMNVRSFKPDTNELCSMCLKQIEYDTMCVFENGLPKRVDVLHNGARVTSKQRN